MSPYKDDTPPGRRGFVVKASDQRDEMLRQHMIDYIRRHFGDILGPQAERLDEPGGLEELAGLWQRQERRSGERPAVP